MKAKQARKADLKKARRNAVASYFQQRRDQREEEAELRCAQLEPG